MPGQPDWGGAPITHGVDELLLTTDTAIAPGATVTHTVTVTRPGYLLEVHAWNASANGAKCPFAVVMRWIDIISGNGLDTQSWYGLAGTVASPHYINGQGPTKGGQLNLEITNLAAAGTNLSMFTLADETSFAYTRHDWRTDDIFAYVISGYTVPSQDINAGLLAVVNNFAVPANSSVSFALPLYNGPVYVQAGNSGAAGSMEVAITAEAEPGGLVGAPTFDMFNDANGNIFARGIMSRIQSLLVVTNHTAAQIHAFVTVAIEER